MRSNQSPACFFVIIIASVLSSNSTQSQERRSLEPASTLRRQLTGPAEPINRAIAAGPGATITVQPVSPKTVPASDYPPGSSISGTTLHLSSVPARVWFETHLTGWAPEMLRVAQVRIDALDHDLDGGGYRGDRADCNGLPSIGAGDLQPAYVPCAGGTCEKHPEVTCISNNDCPGGNDGERCRIRSCTGDPSVECFTDADCINAGTTGPCRIGLHDPCRAALSGITSACGSGEPSRCAPRAPFYEPGGYLCEYAFYNKCDPRDVLNGVSGLSVVDNSTPNLRFGFVVDPGEVVSDFQPTLLAIFILDVPPDARGTYRLDYDANETFLINFNEPPDNQIPVAQVIMGVIETPCGRCCSGFDSGQVQCVDGVGVNDCPNTSDQEFTDGALCPPDGSDCGECLRDSHCDDGVACTVDDCMSNQACNHLVVNEACDDGLFCNGAELCSVSAGCTAGSPPCTSNEVCDEQLDECTLPTGEIPAVSAWGLMILALGLLTVAKIRSQLRGLPE